MTKPKPKDDKINNAFEYYQVWAKKNLIETFGFTPFCRQDNWTGYMVRDFADFIIQQERKKVLDEVLTEFDNSWSPVTFKNWLLNELKKEAIQ